MKRCNKQCLWQISNACIKPSGNWGKCLISKKKKANIKTNDCEQSLTTQPVIIF